MGALLRAQHHGRGVRGREVGEAPREETSMWRPAGRGRQCSRPRGGKASGRDWARIVSRGCSRRSALLSGMMEDGTSLLTGRLGEGQEPEPSGATLAVGARPGRRESGPKGDFDFENGLKRRTLEVLVKIQACDGTDCGEGAPGDLRNLLFSFWGPHSGMCGHYSHLCAW